VTKIGGIDSKLVHYQSSKTCLEMKVLEALWTDLGILVVDLKESVLVCSLCEIVSTRLELEKLIEKNQRGVNTPRYQLNRTHSD
jgi:hypothetical protein